MVGNYCPTRGVFRLIMVESVTFHYYLTTICIVSLHSACHLRLYLLVKWEFIIVNRGPCVLVTQAVDFLRDEHHETMPDTNAATNLNPASNQRWLRENHDGN